MTHPLSREVGLCWSLLVFVGLSCMAGVSLNLSGFPKFTNEVQHFTEVLPWDSNTSRSPLKNLAPSMGPAYCRR